MSEYIGGYDIVGADEVGDYDVGAVDIVGAGKRRMPGLTRGERVMRDEGDVARRQVSPIPLTSIPAGATVLVAFRPQRPLRIERLILDGSVTAGVFLTDLLIGAEPQFVNAGAVPISTFAPTAFGTSLRGNTAQPGIEVTLSIQNTTAGTVVIGGAVIGTSLT
jgi:hypothetical protein